MPQVFMILSPKICEKYSKETIYTLMNIFGQTLIKIVEEVFGIEDKHDVAFTAIPALHTINEALVQIEVKYTVGEDEYGMGKPFDPSKEQKEALATKIKEAIAKYMLEFCSVSVWVRPQRESLFKGI